MVYFYHPNLYVLMKLHYIERMGDTTVRHLGDMDQTILMDADIHESSEVGDIGDDAGQYHSLFEIINGSDVLVEFEFL